MERAVEFDQVQGIVRFGYRKLTECTFLLLTVKNAAAARQWLASAPVTSAATLPNAPDTALQVAFTYSGLHGLGCASALLAQFSMEFQAGSGSSDARARLLGDTGDSAPECWAWGASAEPVDVLLMLYARPGKLEAWKREIQAQPWAEAFRVVAELSTTDLDGVEPFGFPDGLSQPEVDWERQRNPKSIEDTYTNHIALGEFLLGYPNEYNRYTTRPLLPANTGSAEMLPAAEDDPARRDFGRNGCYLVLRTLDQDVTAFWDYVRAQSPTEEDAQELAAAMVGRRKDGTPLAAADRHPAPGVGAAEPRNNFHFNGDATGTQCPFGAHIRRVNPRNGDMPWPSVTGLQRVLALLGIQRKTLHADAKASSRFHRILRRGREFGPAMFGNEASQAASRGLHFICLGANIARQFEFVQSAWIMSTKFDALADESDPLLGSREPISGAPTDLFSIPVKGGPTRKVCGMPRFVRVRGSGYFFLPSIPALRYLAAR